MKGGIDMPKTQTSVLVAAGAIAFAAIIAAAPVMAQTLTPSPPVTSAQAPKAPAATTLQGDLVSVDPDARTVTVKPAQGADQVFKYNDDTKVVGGDKGVAGLATMKGSRVTITFSGEGRERVATQIEIHAK
jgi:hypothetical protein